jgi:hypothetical protein
MMTTHKRDEDEGQTRQVVDQGHMLQATLSLTTNYGYSTGDEGKRYRNSLTDMWRLDMYAISRTLTKMRLLLAHEEIVFSVCRGGK